MRNRFAYAMTVLLAGASLTGCATVARVDPGAFITDKAEKVAIPQVCKQAYDNAIPRVAVAEISNFTTFDYAKMVEAQVAGTSHRLSSGGAAAVSVPGAAGVVWGANERTRFEAEASVIERNVNAKLSESVGDGIADVLANMGGLKLYSRADLKKVIEEQKLQQSGLVDDQQLVQLGKLVGVKYLMTGSIDNVNLSYLSLQRIKDATSRKDNKLLMALMKTAMDNTEGWRVETEINVRMLDVETGEIVLSKKATGKQIVGRMPYPNYDVLVGSIKKAVSKSLADVRADFSRYFAVKGYVMQTKSNPEGTEKIALVSLGENQKVRPGTTLYAYVFEEVQDPMTGNTVCDQQRLPIELSISQQIQSDKAWCTVKCSNPNYLKYVKPGQLVERAPMAGQGYF